MSSVARVPAFDCRVYRERAGGMLVELLGELDLATAPELDRVLGLVEDHNPPLVVLHLEGLEFIDCAGLRALLGAEARRRTPGTRLLVIQGGDQISRLFELTGATAQLPLVSDMPAGPWLPAPEVAHNSKDASSYGPFIPGPSGPTAGSEPGA